MVDFYKDPVVYQDFENYIDSTTDMDTLIKVDPSFTDNADLGLYNTVAAALARADALVAAGATKVGVQLAPYEWEEEGLVVGNNVVLDGFGGANLCGVAAPTAGTSILKFKGSARGINLRILPQADNDGLTPIMEAEEINGMFLNNIFSVVFSTSITPAWSDILHVKEHNINGSFSFILNAVFATSAFQGVKNGVRVTGKSGNTNLFFMDTLSLLFGGAGHALVQENGVANGIIYSFGCHWFDLVSNGVSQDAGETLRMFSSRYSRAGSIINGTLESEKDLPPVYSQAGDADLIDVIDSADTHHTLYWDDTNKVFRSATSIRSDELITDVLSTPGTGILSITDGDGVNQCKINTNIYGGSLKTYGSILRNTRKVTDATFDLSLAGHHHLLIDYAGAVTLNLPNPTFTSGGEFIIKDISGNAGVNNIKLSPYNTDTIDGASGDQVIISTNYAAVKVITDGTDWWIVG